MRLTTVTRAVGRTVAQDLPSLHPGAAPLLRAGATVTASLAASLVARGYHAVWVDDALSAGVDPTEILPAHIRERAVAGVAKALTDAREAFGRNQPIGEATVRHLREIVALVTAHLVTQPDATLVLADLAAADAYTHTHSVNVCSLGLLIGREMFRRDGWTDWTGRQRYDRIDEMLTKLGVGLLLHDVGKIAIPSEILNKPGKLTADEWELMRAHPTLGEQMLDVDQLGPLVLSVVSEHHERWDGAGYPRGLKDTRITQLARIAAVADVYDAVCSARPYKDAAPAHVGVRIVLEGSGAAFDPDVVDVFRRVVFPHPVGSEFELSDGRIGVVIDVNPQEPDSPTVRVAADDGSFEELVAEPRHVALT